MKLRISVRGDNDERIFVEVEGELLEPILGLKALVHKHYENGKTWVISEFYTGMALCGNGFSDIFYKKEQAISEFKERARNEQFFPDPETREKYNLRMLEDILSLNNFQFANTDGEESKFMVDN